jgi:hypothetical protein
MAVAAIDTISGSPATTSSWGAGADTLDGGSGTDQADYWTSSAGVTVNLANAGAQSAETPPATFSSNFENLSGSYYDDTLTGNAATITSSVRAATTRSPAAPAPTRSTAVAAPTRRAILRAPAPSPSTS